MEKKNAVMEFQTLRSDWTQFQIVLCFGFALFSNRISKSNPNSKKTSSSSNNNIIIPILEDCDRSNSNTINFGYNTSTGYSSVISDLIKGNNYYSDGILDDITIRLFFEVFFTKLHPQYISHNYISRFQVNQVKCKSSSKYIHYCFIQCLNVCQIEKLIMEDVGCDN